MRRSRARADGSSVSLFPFLAVLLCTMGALIVILVVITQQARARAVRQAEAAQAPDAEQAAALEGLDWKIEQLTESRDQTVADLERERLTLSHLEDHLRRLRSEAQRLQANAQALKSVATADASQAAAAQKALAKLQRQLAEAQQALSFAREQASRRGNSYAIIPYEGPNRTRRQPIYIECRADRVILQPEGIVLTASDFISPIGPSNPLALALRATREFFQTAQPNTDEPYPLLLVRPNGILAYYKAREAIESWGPEFGYELIGQDWQLEFPPKNPQLATVQQQAVGRGRAVLTQLARAAPSRYRSGGYRATSHRGGFVRESGGGLSEAHTTSGDGLNGSGNRSGSESAWSTTQRRATAQPSQQRSATAGHSQAAAESLAQGSNSGQQAAGGQPGGAAAGGTAGCNCEPVANVRGPDWALPNAGSGSTPLTRPVRVLVRPQWLAIGRKDGALLGRQVAMPGSTEEAVEEFVDSLWEHMRQWGIAGQRLYWKPVLILSVDPQASERARELMVLLEGSGLEVQIAGEQTPR